MYFIGLLSPYICSLSFTVKPFFFFLSSSLGCHHKAHIILSGLAGLFGPQETDVMQVPPHMVASCHKHTVHRDESKFYHSYFRNMVWKLIQELSVS